jgi:type II restriction enzyme
MQLILTSAVHRAQQSEAVYTKFISANDVGKTSHSDKRSHQSGYYISKSFLGEVFEQQIVKGTDYEAFVTIKWQCDFETQSRFKYFSSKNECHLTRFGDNFPYRTDDNIGDLLIICKESKEYYHAFVLQSDEDIEDFLDVLNISATQTNRVISSAQPELFDADRLLRCFAAYIQTLKVDFPLTVDLALQARTCYNKAYAVSSRAVTANPDKVLINWLEAEFQLFKTLENDRYQTRIKTPFKSVEELVGVANTILNRRKSRAGNSLEHHLSEIFKTFTVPFAAQAVTEDNKKPDFLFPGKEAYDNPAFAADKLISLASKTTCKDRWRQVLNEADRIKTKHLFTLQQGISEKQLNEMYKYNVCLVVPKQYIEKFPQVYRDKILTLHTFIRYVQAVQQL